MLVELGFGIILDKYNVYLLWGTQEMLIGEHETQF